MSGNRNWQSKATNYALRADMNEAEFIQEATMGLLSILHHLWNGR
jgi:hypothetical protein